MRETSIVEPGTLVRLRDREWVVLPASTPDTMRLRPLGGADEDATVVYLPVEPQPPVLATFDLPDPRVGSTQETARLLKDALRLKLRAGAGPFRSFGSLNVEPRAYQLVPLLMALKQDTVRLLVADDAGVGKTIEAGLIARELLDRGEITRLTVICPPHLCEQWQKELRDKFNIRAEVVRTGTAARLERGLRPDESIFEAYAFTIVSLDYIKSDRRRHDFQRACPEFVIVDEAHACVQSNTHTRHQRYRLLQGLATGRPRRNLVLLTATPHSGDDTAFHNLLGLLDDRFAQLADMPDSAPRRALREELAGYFVQRRRGDIAEWKEAVGFPVRESRESTYKLTGDWGDLFDDVLAYARALVQRSAGGTKLQQRMSWWAALALLRCLSSSPAAAQSALRTRLEAAEGSSVETLDEMGAETVLDGTSDDILNPQENVPAGVLDDPEDSAALRQLIARADRLRGPDQDSKLSTLIQEIGRLWQDDFHPVVFCRYIATAHYVGEQLRQALPRRTEVLVVTGELTPDQREATVESIGDLAEGIRPILVATDCLSEGMNLQHYVNAVIHYDLTWNPTRHEQREGRADRFGQASPVVRTLMLYGEDNPVDGAVLRVILKKADKIRSELGVSVPLPTDGHKVVDAVMQAVLMQRDRRRQEQLFLELTDTERQVDSAWITARNRMTRTVFAQQRLHPEDVMPEWHRSVAKLGGPEDVARFVHQACASLGSPLEKRQDCSLLFVNHLPNALQERLQPLDIHERIRVVFAPPVPSRALHVYRSHPLVTTLAEYIAEQALEGANGAAGARSHAMYTPEVRQKTVLFLLRLRNHIQVRQRSDGGRRTSTQSLLAEECIGVALRSRQAVPEVLDEAASLALLSLEPGRNMPPGQQQYLVRQALQSLPSLEETFNRIARERCRELLADHTRVREASARTGLRYEVTPSLPTDKIGVYVFMPMSTL